jgi:ribosomal protein L7/L12
MLTSHLYTAVPNATPRPMTAGAARTPAGPDARLAAAPGDALEAEIRQIAAEGNFLHAIKLYRERTGCGLREARDAVARICGI